MRLFVKIKGGAIQYVLVISVIIIIVLFAFISLIFLQKKTQLKSELHKEAIHATYLAFDYLKQHAIPYDIKTKQTFTEYDFEKTTILKKKWGIFDLVIVQSILKNETFQKVALMGNLNENRKTLYLQENNQPLKVVGNTRITGDVIVPKRGISTGNISGVSYYGSQLVYGKMNTNANQLPKIQNIEDVKELSLDPYFENSVYFELENGLKMDQPFTKETLLFESNGELHLSQMSLKGNIVISSETKIHVAASAKLENILLIAPEIIIESGVKGSFQVFANKRIDVKENVSLNYPSSLVVVKEADKGGVESQIESKGIQIGENVHIKGVVLYYSLDKKEDYKTEVYINEKSQVIGEVYCNKNLELRGRVDGFVYTNKFITKEAGRVFVNHLYNATINGTVISEKYNGLFIDTESKGVAKWIE